MVSSPHFETVEAVLLIFTLRNENTQSLFFEDVIHQRRGRLIRRFECAAQDTPHEYR
jgi:hypothetical protein